jgi:hypothetical protein
MVQAISGVTPNQEQEATVMVVWPSNAYFGLGRFLGRLYALDWGFYIFRLGNIFALLSMPLGAILALAKVAPVFGVRYHLTNRRILVERGLKRVCERSLALDRFNRIDIEIRNGQAWYDAGDLIFHLDAVETFRLESVSRPAAFRQTCLKSHASFVGVKRAQSSELAGVA